MHAESVSEIRAKVTDGRAKVSVVGSLTRHAEEFTDRDPNFV